MLRDSERFQGENPTERATPKILNSRNSHTYTCYIYLNALILQMFVENSCSHKGTMIDLIYRRLIISSILMAERFNSQIDLALVLPIT